MMLSPRTAVRALHAEKERPMRKGALPFKKRRFPSLALSLYKEDGTEGPRSSLRAASESNAFKESESKVAPPSAERIAALALVAAAASGNNVPTDFTDKESSKKHGFLLCEEQAADLSPSTATSFEEVENPDSASGFDASSAGKKVHRQPLTSPLPNGCHSRTSRHNSFCRRQPYNGSKFCKTHYQGIVASGVASEEDLKNGKVFHAGELPDSVKDASSEGTGSTGIVVPSIQQQDKRYNGASTEARCKATTTRGRACGYCAVDGSKYCHLHATFDTNPPPRRGGSSLVNAPKGGSLETKLAASTSKNAQGGATCKAEGTKRRRLSATKNLKKYMEHAPYPLLSTLPTEQWLHQKVIVSTGPLTNHVGSVEKWGNGWITVRLPGVGLHNRRSFELYLHPDPDSDTSGSKLGVDEQGSRIEVFDVAMDRSPAPKDSDGNLSPKSFHGNGKVLLDSNPVHEVTPLVSSRVIKAKEASGSTGSIMFPTCLSPKVPRASPDTIPESPVRPDDVSMGKNVAKASSNDFKDSAESNQLPTQLGENSMPLMKSLMLTQNQRAAKQHGLDWLFSTGSLDKSRLGAEKTNSKECNEFALGAKENDINESVHVALENTKKRDSTPFLEVEFEGRTKRLRLKLSSTTEEDSSMSTPVVTSSEDENLGLSSSEVPV